MNTQSQSNLFKGKGLEVYSKLSGRNYWRARSITFLVFDWLRNLVLILYKSEDGEIEFCGVADADVMKRCWGKMDSIHQNKIKGKVKGTVYRKENDVNNYSFFKACLDEMGHYEHMKYIQAHHISGNHYCHLTSNGILLIDKDHLFLHENVEEIMEQGYEAFISHIADVGVPHLSECYENPDKAILLSIKSDKQFQDDMIRFFCGSDKNYEELRKTLLEKTDGQTEKEIRFDLTF